MEKLLSRNVIVNGENRGLAIVSVDGISIKIKPFEKEEEGTAYVDAPIIIDTAGSRPLVKIEKS